MSNGNQQVWFEVQYESGFTAFYSKAKLCNATSYNSAVNPASGKLLRHHQKPVNMTMPPHQRCRRSLWRSRGWRLCWQGGRKRALQLAAWSTQKAPCLLLSWLIMIQIWANTLQQCSYPLCLPCLTPSDLSPLLAAPWASKSPQVTACH